MVVALPFVTFTTRPCMVCGQSSRLVLDAAGFASWQAGALVQEAFPLMPADEREQLITGTHPSCWDTMFGDEE